MLVSLHLGLFGPLECVASLCETKFLGLFGELGPVDVLGVVELLELLVVLGLLVQEELDDFLASGLLLLGALGAARLECVGEGL
jgi:hypothetical protein